MLQGMVSRIISGFILILLLVFGFSTYVVYSMHEIKSVESTSIDTIQRFYYQNQAQRYFLASVADIRGYFAYGQDRYLLQYKIDAGMYDKNMQTAIELATPEYQESLQEAYDGSKLFYANLDNKVIPIATQLINAPQTSERAALQKQFNKAIQSNTTYSSDLVATLEVRMDDNFDILKQSMSDNDAVVKTLNIMIVTFSLIITVICIAFVALALRLHKPFKDLSMEADRIADKNLTKYLQIRHDSELAELTVDIDHAVINMRKIIAGLSSKK